MTHGTAYVNIKYALTCSIVNIYIDIFVILLYFLYVLGIKYVILK